MEGGRRDTGMVVVTDTEKTEPLRTVVLMRSPASALKQKVFQLFCPSSPLWCLTLSGWWSEPGARTGGWRGGGRRGQHHRSPPAPRRARSSEGRDQCRDLKSEKAGQCPPVHDNDNYVKTTIQTKHRDLQAPDEFLGKCGHSPGERERDCLCLSPRQNSEICVQFCPKMKICSSNI